MRAFRCETGRVAVLDRPDVDTDQIVPKQFIARIARSGYGDILFHDWRFDENGNERSEFPLNRAAFRDAQILLTGSNFGCGSSREHAVWALQNYGFFAVIAPSFGEIFRTNAGKSGLLTITLSDDAMRRLIAGVDASSGATMTVDLERCVIVSPGSREIGFEFDETLRGRFMEGLDEIAVTLQYADAITVYESAKGEGGGSPRLRAGGVK